MQLRAALPEDRDAIVALIDGIYREYGDRLCLENADSDLNGVPASYESAGGGFVVLDDGGRVRGTHATLPTKDRPGVCNFCRLYLDAQLRGGGWGGRLMQWGFDWARERDFRRVEFWSDTRFTRAHQFYERLGFTRDGRRKMDDGWEPYEEYFFCLDLAPPDEAEAGGSTDRDEA